MIRPLMPCPPQHLGVVQYYDLPNISIKNLILPSILEDDKLLRKWFHRKWVEKPGQKDKQPQSDLRHVSLSVPSEIP